MMATTCSSSRRHCLQSQSAADRKGKPEKVSGLVSEPINESRSVSLPRPLLERVCKALVATMYQGSLHRSPIVTFQPGSRGVMRCSSRLGRRRCLSGNRDHLGPRCAKGVRSRTRPASNYHQNNRHEYRTPARQPIRSAGRSCEAQFWAIVSTRLVCELVPPGPTNASPFLDGVGRPNSRTFRLPLRLQERTLSAAARRPPPGWSSPTPG